MVLPLMTEVENPWGAHSEDFLKIALVDILIY